MSRTRCWGFRKNLFQNAPQFWGLGGVLRDILRLAMNKSTLFILSLGAVLVPALTLAQTDLSRYRGKNRLLLVFAPSKADPRWQTQNSLLAGSAADFQERDLLRFDCLEQGGNKNAALRSRCSVKPGQFRVLLIGKDGHVASGGPTPLCLHALTGQIDKMPMRREEMRRAGQR